MSKITAEKLLEAYAKREAELRDFKPQGDIRDFGDLTKYLNLGSIVRLKDMQGDYMIIGRFYCTDIGRFDYLAAPYPLGFVSQRLTKLFNNSDISAVMYQFPDTVASQYMLKVMEQRCAELEAMDKNGGNNEGSPAGV